MSTRIKVGFAGCPFKDLLQTFWGIWGARRGERGGGGIIEPSKFVA